MLARKNSNRQETSKNVVNLSQETRQKLIVRLNQDSDQDGLKDWEEEIYGTNPKNADTDGDKTTDGEEIKISRDPLKAGPHDDLATSTLPKIDLSDYPSPNNLTHRLIEKFGEKFVIPKIANPSSPLDAESIGVQIAEEILAGKKSAVKTYFTLKDVKTIKQNDQNSFQKYAREFNAITNSAFQGLDESELLIFSEAVRNEELFQLEKLDPYLTAYAAALNKYKKMAVPSELANLHLAYLNTLSREQKAVEKMRKAEKDALAGAYGAQDYMTINKELTSLTQKFQKEFNRFP